MPYYNDDGTELFPDRIPIPGLCLVCRLYHDADEEVVCNLTRLDQCDDPEFECHGFCSVDKT